MSRLLSLFRTFLSINLLIPCGPAAVDLLHEEAVASSRALVKEEFVSDVR